MSDRPAVTWLDVAWASAVALVGASLTYAVFYGARILDARSVQQVAPELILFLISVTLSGLLAFGLHWHRLLRPAGLLAGFLVFGHIVWGAVAINVSAAFVLSNWCEMAVSLLLVHAASEADPH